MRPTGSVESDSIALSSRLYPVCGGHARHRKSAYAWLRACFAPPVVNPGHRANIVVASLSSPSRRFIAGLLSSLKEPPMAQPMHAAIVEPVAKQRSRREPPRASRNQGRHLVSPQARGVR